MTICRPSHAAARVRQDRTRWRRSPRHAVYTRSEARVSAVDVRDIAATAATVLTQSDHQGKTYTITGPAAVTHAEIARAISDAIRREVRFVDVPPQIFGGALEAAGLPPWQIEGLIEDYTHCARGEAAAIHSDVHAVTGVEARSMVTFARDYARAFLGESAT